MEHNEHSSTIRPFDGQTLTLLMAERSSREAKKQTQTQTQTSLRKDLLAGGIAGTAGIAIGHPFDTIKVRLQQQQPPPPPQQPLNTPKIPAARLKGNPSTYRGLYRGIGAPLLTAAVVNASVFCTYGATSRLWDDFYPNSTGDSGGLIGTTVAKQAVCGAVTGFSTSLVLCPIEYVKIRLQTMQLQPGSSVGSGSSFHLAKEILGSRYGVRGLYRGLFATILRQTPSLAVYFPVYNILKESIGELYTSRSYSNTTNSNINNNSSPWWSSALAGGLAGCLSWTIIYPIDAVKSRIQSLPLDTPAKSRSFFRIARTISRNEGFVGLLVSRGLAVTLLRAFPVNGTIFFVYEFINQWLKPLDGSIGANESGGTDTMSNLEGSLLRIKPQRTITLRVENAVETSWDAS